MEKISVKRSIEIYGLIKDVEFHKAKVTAEGLCRKHKDSNLVEPIIKGMLEHEWLEFLTRVKQTRGSTMMSYNDTSIIFIDDEPIGNAESFIKWCSSEYEYKDFKPLPLFFAMSKMAYEESLLDKQHDIVYMDINIGENCTGRLVIELFNDVLPRTCENFKELCSGGIIDAENNLSSIISLSYKSTILHRIVKNGWIQGGDIVHGSGDNGWSIYGETFEDENYSVLHNKRGIVGMANKGRHTNSSQFYFTLQPTPWMDCQYVAFGQVIEGLGILDKLENIETYNERPVVDCIIKDCGLFDYKKL